MPNSHHGAWLTRARSISAWAVHRSINIFGPDANVFRPARWLDVPEAQLNQMERNNDLIFGYGRFKCLGQSVALIELNKVFVEVRCSDPMRAGLRRARQGTKVVWYLQLLRRYDITLIDPSKPWNSVNAGIFLQKGMWVRITRRGGGMD